jgi:glycosyltransferase involved in cell wall biosynthesis
MNAILRRPAQPQSLDEWAPSLLKAQLYGRLLLDIIIGVLPPGETLDENVLARRYDGGLAGIRDGVTFHADTVAVTDTGVTARFVGDFRSTDREWAKGISDRIELIPYAPHRKALELQRDSDALLLLIPEAGGRGRGVLSGKVFEYLAAERPILAVVPPDGAAADLLRESGAGVVVAPDDIDGMVRELTALRDRWRSGDLPATPLTDEWKAKVSRRARIQDLADVLHRVEAAR